MEFRFANADLERLYYEAGYTMGLSSALVQAYRKAMGYLAQALDERDLRARRSFHFEKLRGDRGGQYSLRLNRQFRLIVALEGTGGTKQVAVLEIVDYH